MVQGRGNKKTPVRLMLLLKHAVNNSSQSAVARETGLTQSAIHRYLKGIGEPSSETLSRFAKYFKTTEWVLRDGIDLNEAAPFAICAKCGNELEPSPEGFPQTLEDGTDLLGDGILRLWPCETCCKGKSK